MSIPDNTKNKEDDKRYYCKKIFDDTYADPGHNCVEIVKERETGIQDMFIPLWFEQSTKRLKCLSARDKNLVYKWDFDGFIGREEIPFEDGGAADDN